MKTIAIIAQKGGATKSTLAVHLAVEAEINGKTAMVIDVDPQQSAVFWKDERGKAKPPAVESVHATRLVQALELARSIGVDVVFLDTQANSNSIATISTRNADFVIIPTKCSRMDLMAVGASVDIVKGEKKQGVIVLCAVPPRGTKGERAREKLTEENFGIEICPIFTGKREIFGNATDIGLTAQEYEPQGKAAEEIRSLYKWVSEKINL